MFETERRLRATLALNRRTQELVWATGPSITLFRSPPAQLFAQGLPVALLNKRKYSMVHQAAVILCSLVDLCSRPSPGYAGSTPRAYRPRCSSAKLPMCSELQGF